MLVSNTCFRVVVLPAPRKPDRTLTGSGFEEVMVAAAARTWSSGSAGDDIGGGVSAGTFGGGVSAGTFGGAFGGASGGAFGGSGAFCG